MKIAVAQIDCEVLEVAKNVTKMVSYIERSKSHGAELVLFPELVDTAYDMQDMSAVASNLDKDEPISKLKTAARNNEMYVVVGLSEKTDTGIYNVAVVIDPNGAIVCKYRKVHLYTPSGEGVFEPGDELVTFKIGEFTFGFMICYDIRFPEMARSLALEGADVLVVPTAWPFPRVEHWQLLTRVRALENQCYLLGANRVGTDHQAVLSGNSRIVDPHGVIVSSASEDREEIIYATLKKENIQFIRNRMPIFDHRRPEIYSQK